MLVVKPKDGWDLLVCFLFLPLFDCKGDGSMERDKIRLSFIQINNDIPSGCELCLREYGPPWDLATVAGSAMGTNVGIIRYEHYGHTLTFIFCVVGLHIVAGSWNVSVAWGWGGHRR